MTPEDRIKELEAELAEAQEWKSAYEQALVRVGEERARADRFANETVVLQQQLDKLTNVFKVYTSLDDLRQVNRALEAELAQAKGSPWARLGLWVEAKLSRAKEPRDPANSFRSST